MCKRVLVVDDDRDIRETMLDVLNEEGFDATGAAHGGEALAALVTGPLPCLIFLDLMMPVMDGRAFREQQLRDVALARIPVVVISAHRGADDATALGAAGFLSKPLRILDLLGAIEAHARCERAEKT